MLPPSTTLRPASPAELVKQVASGPSRARMMEAENRRLILEGDWRPLVWSLLLKYNYNNLILQAVAARVKRTPNVAKQVIRKVALAYKVPPQRSIADASEDTERAFRRLVLEQGKLQSHPQRWERLVWGLNVVITVPVVYPAPGQPFGRRLGYELLLPSDTEVVTIEDSPTALPIASVTSVVESGYAAQDGPRKWCVLDDKAWTTFDSRGTQISRVEHGMGVWPGTVWRREDGADFWCQELGAGLFDATLEVAHIGARMDWIRQGQDHKREFLFCEDLKAVPRQVAGSDGPVEVELSPSEIKYETHDASVPIAEHVKHQIRHARAGAEALGVDADLVDWVEGSEGIEPIVAAQKHDELMGLRTATTVHFGLAEKDSAWKTGLALQGAAHPLAPLLRPSALADDFEAVWSELDFVDEPEARLRVLEGEVNLGLKSTVDAYMAKHPGMTREQAKKEIRRIDEEEAERAEFLAKRNTPRLVRDRRSNVAELQGRIGGMTGGEARREARDDRDSERSDESAADPERGRGTNRPADAAAAGRSARARGRR
jgi:hypothetical protein